MQYHYPEGATLLDPDEATGLKPNHITTQNELNEWEQNNIVEAEVWVFSKNYSYQKILTIEFVRNLHKQMFNLTWQWAGKFRQTAKNIGVESSQITSELKNLLDDVYYQIEHETYDINEIAYRLHHRLVKVHPFANGNGRHARLITDVLLINLGQERFTWGKASLIGAGPTRRQYIDALQQADKGNYKLLAGFVRS